MNLTNADPRPRSRRVNDSRNTLKRTQAPNSPAVRWERRNGVRSSVAARFQNLPRRLKNVLAINFREKSPRNVIGRLFCSIGSVMSLERRGSDSLALLLKNGTTEP